MLIIFCSAGATLCVKVFPDTADWQEASENCDREHNSDLFNVRQFEEFSEFDDPLKQRINEDLANKSKQKLETDYLLFDSMVEAGVSKNAVFRFRQKPGLILQNSEMLALKLEPQKLLEQIGMSQTLNIC